MTKHFLLSLLFIASTAQAAQLKVDGIENTWRVNYIPKTSEVSIALGSPELTITSSMHRGTELPTVIVQKVTGRPVPRTTEEWREVVLMGKTLRPDKERTLIRKGTRALRYIGEFSRQILPTQSTKALIMGTVVNGEIYLFIYQNHMPQFSAVSEDIFKLYRTMDLSVE